MPDVISSSAAFFLVVAPIALLVFFLVWEGPEGRFRFASTTERWRHIGVNLALLLIATGLRALDLPGAARGLFPATAIEWTTVGWSTPLLAGRMPVWAIVSIQFAVAVIAVDLFEYWRHRVHHRYRWLWRLHRVHHNDPLLDASSAGRIHPVESLVSTVLTVAVLALAGVPIWIEVLRATLVNPVVFAQHANVRFGPALERIAGPWLAGPEWHRVHHSRDMTEQNCNFGQFFSIWDRLFGTNRAAPPDGVGTMGVDGLDDPRAQSLSGLLLLPARAVR
jgi:sterol desaturase/sphingolipid hydroxylase (fatty acid hydroxylase superfamily)